jgi:peptidoglycan/xylan/chitin deacetylase (PgdA/CDA1 family)
MPSVQKSLPILLFLLLVSLFFASISVFFDQAVLVRRQTIYYINTPERVVALTFDDGPSLEWTPKILNELKKEGIKATFFMIGRHVREYPEVARRVAREGHEIGNHTYNHHILLYYKNTELSSEIIDAERIIRDITGRKTIYFRPPKAWLTCEEKREIRKLGYKIVLWTLNSKDWVTFDDKYIIRYILRHIQPGDILLFHDSGGVFKTEGGDRHETVKAVAGLIKKLKSMGYRFVTISELLKLGQRGKYGRQF